MLSDIIGEIKESMRIQSQTYDRNTADKKYYRRAFNQGAMHAYGEVLGMLEKDQDVQRYLEEEGV